LIDLKTFLVIGYVRRNSDNRVRVKLTSQVRVSLFIMQVGRNEIS